jgi:cytoskeletal protein RodZ
MSSQERVTAPFPSSFDRDLENARVLLEESPWKDNPQKYRKVAETILRRILSFDPANKSAKRLLEKSVEIPVSVTAPEARVAHASVEVPISAPKIDAPPATPKIPKIETPPAPPKIDVPVAQAPAPRRPVAPPDFSFVVDNRRPLQKEPSSRPPWLLLALAMAGAIGGVTLLVANRDTITPEYTPKAPVAVPKVFQASASVVPVASAAPSSSSAVPANSSTVPEEPVRPSASVESLAKVETAPAQATVVVKSSVQPVAPLVTGTLAVSSPTTVDIYMGDQLLGSAPTTLVLPAGNQTLEYRHQDMRKLMTHVIKANETTTATVTFDVTVQINAKPWAQVFIDGSKRQPLGQTPLSDVRVPIGGNLVFENPNFPAKSYRITGRETEIRVTFP